MWIQNMDGALLLWIQEHLRAEFFTPFWKIITCLGDGGWFWILVTLILLCSKKWRPAGAAAALSLLIGFLVTNLLLKNLIARPRPYDAISAIVPLIARPSDFSFPSGHSTASFACALVCVRMLPKRYGIPAVCLAVLIAFSRLYLAVHYPLDVLAGFVIGLCASLTACCMIKRMPVRR